jgi:hypothetical protein
MYVCSSPPGLYTSFKQKLTEKPKKIKKKEKKNSFIAHGSCAQTPTKN